MKLSKNDLLKIEKAGRFLEEKGFIVTRDEYDVTYTDERLAFVAGVEPNSDQGVLYIHFTETNKWIDVGWIYIAKNEEEKLPTNQISRIIALMEYAKKNYDKLTDAQFCESCKKDIEIFFKKHKEERDALIRDFLEKIRKKD